jgi:hypothetical protein
MPAFEMAHQRQHEEYWVAAPWLQLLGEQHLAAQQAAKRHEIAVSSNQLQWRLAKRYEAANTVMITTAWWNQSAMKFGRRKVSLERVAMAAPKKRRWDHKRPALQKKFERQLLWEQK